MSSRRDPDRDLRLERLGDRDGLRRAHLGEAAQVRALEAATGGVREYRADQQALADAAFAGPGAAAWLAALRKRIAAIVSRG